MRYEIKGGSFPIVVCNLGSGEQMITGEGLFNTLLTGPGKVWLQTMPISNVAASIRPYIPTGNG